MMFFYAIFLHVLALFALPKFLYDLIVKKKYRQSFFARAGKGFPKVDKQGRPLIWVHAVSLGETKAILPLIKLLKQHPSKPLILLSTGTETGYKEGSRMVADIDYHVFLPFDFPYIIRPLVKQVAPDLVLLCETDFWLNFLDAARKCGAQIALVNGKLSSRSLQRMKWVPFFTKAIFSNFDLLCVQGQLYAERFLELGIPKEKLHITGNIKLDGAKELIDKGVWRNKFSFDEKDLILTLGSTHDPEETYFLEALIPLFQLFPRLKVLIVPRHPERFEKVASLIEKTDLSWGQYSKGNMRRDNRVILVDAMGVLLSCFQISDVAFVGGTLTDKVGGHNILEPCFYGVPVIYGPHTYKQPDLVDLSRRYGAGVEVALENLREVLKDFFENEVLRREVGDNGLKLVMESKGALEKTYGTICQLREKRGE